MSLTLPAAAIERRASCLSEPRAIKYLSAADYERLGAEIVLGNTYHLMLRPGAETVAALGGLGRFAGWNGLTLTDSGGFQVFSLDPDVVDDGVTFKSTYDGSTIRFTPEIAVHTQELLGADIQMVLDVCPPLPSPPRRSAWPSAQPRGRPGLAAHDATTRRCSESSRWHRRGDAHRERPANWALSSTGTHRWSQCGETRGEMVPALAAHSQLPADRPPSDGRRRSGQPGRRGPLGVDQFDCVMQTRIGRTARH